MKYLFGPVPSRRLGMSLGVDLVPHKVCSLDCVYCECGATKNLTLERKEYILYDKVIVELEEYFKKNQDPDYITFSGNGEPTLNSRLGDVLKFIKNLKPNIPVAILTNGTLLWDKQVRNEMLLADIVLPSFDANLDADFRKINRPVEGLELEKYLQGLIDFKKEFKGQIWIEVLIIPDYNDSSENILRLKDALREINPDKIQINTLDRPGTVLDLRAASLSELKNIKKIWDLPNAEIIASVPQRKNIVSYRTDVEATILDTISRRPCTLQDLSSILGLHINEINKYLGVLENEQKIITISQKRGFFYTTNR